MKQHHKLELQGVLPSQEKQVIKRKKGSGSAGKLTSYSCLTLDVDSVARAAAAAAPAHAARAAAAAAAQNRKKSKFERQCWPISPHLGITSKFWARRNEGFTDDQPKAKRVYYPDSTMNVAINIYGYPDWQGVCVLFFNDIIFIIITTPTQEGCIL